MTRVGQNWGDWAPWTPTLVATTTSPTLGTGATQTGSESVEGTVVHWKARIVLGAGATTGEGHYQIPLPYDPALEHVTVGHGYVAEAETPHQPWIVTVALDPTLAATVSADPTRPFLFLDTRSRAVNVVGADNPGEWGAGDIIDLAGFYEAATAL